MILYDCKVRLAGNVNNEVFKSEVTAAEVMLLRVVHGDDAILNIVQTGKANRSHADERARLMRLYASPENNNTEQLTKKRALFRDLFGHDSVPLPLALPDEQVAGVADKPKRAKVEEPAEKEFA